MLLNRICVMGLALFFLFITPGLAQKKPADPPILFTLNKKPVYADEIIYLYRKPNQNKPEEYTKEKIEDYLELFTRFKLKVEEARNRGYDTTETFQKEYNTYREELRKPYLPDGKLIDSLTLLTYNRLKEEVRASHILLNLPPDASPSDTARVYDRIMALRDRVIKGEDFGTVAAELSEDPSAKMNRGDLGFFTAMQMVFPFEQAAYNTPVGDVSMPVRTQFGYHLIKVMGRQPARGEVEVSHIMLRTGPNQDNDKARNTIFEIHDKLQKGVAWEELCREYSEDMSSKENGGKLRPFGVGTMATAPRFEEAAFKLKSPGDFSDPVKTQFGWHILRLNSKIPLPAYGELAPSLRNRVSRDERTQISRNAVRSKMKKEFGFDENNHVKDRIFALADSTLQKGIWKPATSSLQGETLLTINKQSIAADKFFAFVKKTQRPTNLEPKKYIEQLYNQFVDEFLGLALEEKIKARNPDYAWLLKEYYEGILLFEIMEKEVWNKATEDSVGQARFFEANRDKYRAGERVQARLFSSSSVTVMDQIRKFLEAGDSTKLNEWVKKEKVRQESGNYEKTDRPVFAKVQWAPGVYRTENNGLQYVVLIQKILPPGNRTFAEARAAVISDYQTDLENRWIAKLKKKYPVKVNKKGKQYLMDQLLKSKT